MEINKRTSRADEMTQREAYGTSSRVLLPVERRSDSAKSEGCSQGGDVYKGTGGRPCDHPSDDLSQKLRRVPSPNSMESDANGALYSIM